MISCDQIPSAYRSACVQQLQVYVPDPTSAKECIDGMGLTCADVATKDALKEVEATCVYDTSTFACDENNTVLTFCSPATPDHASRCKSIDCPATCVELGGSGDCHFGPDGWDECVCYL
jgi:hypothetical protein